jgi:hypothetical protein
MRESGLLLHHLIAETIHERSWVRDNVMVANSFRLRGQLARAIACMKGLTLFLVTQRPRFHEIIADPGRA